MKKRSFEETLLVRANHMLEEFYELGKLAKKMKQVEISSEEQHVNHIAMAELAEELLKMDTILKQYEMEWLDNDSLPTFWRALVAYKKQQEIE